MTRFNPEVIHRHQVPGLMLACVLQPASVKLLLGCTDDEVREFQQQARNDLADIKARIQRAKAV